MIALLLEALQITHGCRNAIHLVAINHVLLVQSTTMSATSYFADAVGAVCDGLRDSVLGPQASALDKWDGVGEWDAGHVGGGGVVDALSAGVAAATDALAKGVEKVPKSVHMVSFLMRAIPASVLYLLAVLYAACTSALCALVLEALIKRLRIERLSSRFKFFVNRKHDGTFAMFYTMNIGVAGLVLMGLSMCAMEVPMTLMVALGASAAGVISSAAMETVIAVADSSDFRKREDKGAMPAIRRRLFLHSAMGAAAGAMIMSMATLRNEPVTLSPQ
jgi:hypothetical protein